jgi:hydroxymethylglutaryl-CoA lyase
VPSQVKELILALKDEFGPMRLRAHFHNTRNTGIANAQATIETGIDSLDASIGGIGGCPLAPLAKFRRTH